MSSCGQRVSKDDTDDHEGTAMIMKSGLSTSQKTFYILRPGYQVQHGAVTLNQRKKTFDRQKNSWEV